MKSNIMKLKTKYYSLYKKIAIHLYKYINI